MCTSFASQILWDYDLSLILSLRYRGTDCEYEKVALLQIILKVDKRVDNGVGFDEILNPRPLSTQSRGHYAASRMLDLETIITVYILTNILGDVHHVPIVIFAHVYSMDGLKWTQKCSSNVR